MDEKIKIELPDAEWAEWTCLVERGKKLRERGEHLKGLDENKHDRVTSVRRDRRKTDRVKVTPERVRKWILARHNGLSMKNASQLANVTWGEVRMSYLECEECRCAFDAMHEDSRHLMKEMAYSSMEDALNGVDVTKYQYRAAETILSSMETEHFGSPRDRSGLVVTDGKVLGGGITINLIDVSKGYHPPAAALIGDGDDAVEV